jgi:hypothetical protein
MRSVGRHGVVRSAQGLEAAAFPWQVITGDPRALIISSFPLPKVLSYGDHVPMGVALDWKLRANRLKRERNMAGGSGHRRIVPPPYVIGTS